MRPAKSFPRPASPTREQIFAARQKFDLSQHEAAALIYCGIRGWQMWEYGQREMHPLFWEAFVVKAAALKKRRDKEAASQQAIVEGIRKLKMHRPHLKRLLA